MPRLRHIGLWAVALVAITLVAVVVVALTIDPDAYRPAVQRRLTQALGREVSIERLSFGLSMRPTLAVRSLSLANPAWASRPLLLTARQGAARVDLVELWHGRVEIRSLALEGVDVLLERNRDGTGNWVLGAADQAVGNREQPRFPDFDSISLRDAQIGWRDAAGQITRTRIDEASAVVRTDRPFELEARGILRDTPLTFALKSNVSLQSGLQGGPATIALAVKTQTAQADLEIAMPKLFGVEGMTVKMNGQAERLAALSALAGRTLPDWGPFQLGVQATVGEDTVRLTAVRVTIDGLPSAPKRIEISAGEAVLGRKVPTSVRLQGKADGADFSLDATTAALAGLTEATGALPVKGKVALAGLELAAKGSVGRDSFPPAFDLDVDAKGDIQQAARLLGVLSLRRALRVQLSAHIAGDGQRMRAQQAHGSVAGCTVGGDLAIERAQRLRLTGKLDLGRLDLSAFEVDVAKQEPSHKVAPGTGPGWMRAFDADLRLNVQRIVGLPIPVADLSGHAVLADGRLGLRDFRGSLAGTLLGGDAQLQWRAARPYLDATVHVPVLDLARLTATTGADRTGRGFDTPLPLAPVRALDADLQVDIGRIRNAPIPIDRLRTSARLARGRLTLSPLGLELAGVPAQSTLTLDASSDDARVSGRISAPGIEVAPLLRALNAQPSVSGRLGPVGLKLETHGGTPRAWLERAQISAQVGASVLSMREMADAIRIGQASATAGPGAPVRAQLRGSVRDWPIELSVTGGALAELVTATQAWPRITGELRTTVRQQEIRLSALTGPLDRLTSARNVPIRVEAATNGARATATGTIADLSNPESTPLRAEIAVASLARLPLLWRESPLPDVPLSASARLALDRRAISLDGLVVRSGQSDLSGQIRVQWEQRVKLSADLSAQMLDLAPWLSAKPATDLGEAAAARLDKPFPLQALRAVDAELRLRAAHVTGPYAALSAVELNGALTDGVLDASASAAEGEYRFDLRFDARSEPPAIATRVSVKDLDPESLKLTSPELTGADLPRLSLSGTMAGRGLTPRQVYASATGNILFTAGPGRVREVASPFAIQGVFRTLLTTLTPGRRPEDYDQLECAAARFEIANGIATSPDGIALRFKRMDILGSGAINLATRELLFGFKAVRRQWLSFSTLEIASDFVRIGGTLDKPNVGLDPGNLLIRGGAAGATFGISLLATDFLRKLRAMEDPCRAIASRGRTSADPLEAPIQAVPLPGQQPAGTRPAGERERR